MDQIVPAAGRSRPSLAFATPAHPCAMESHASQFTPLTTHTIKNPEPLARGCLLVEAAGIEPASASDSLSALHAYPSLNLTDGYPDGGEDQQRSWISFNGSTPGVLHRDPV